MNIVVTDNSLAWFKAELNLKVGDSLRIYTRYGGFASNHPAFSLGFSKEPPREVGVSCLKDGILFFVEEPDLWYFQESDLVVDYNLDKDEIEFQIGSSK